MTDLETNVEAVNARVAAAARRAGRDPAGVTVVAVSKYQPAAVIRAAYDLGLRHFGENRVGEAQPKIGELPGDITWHMIGHVQSRQAKAVVPLFHVIHSVDSVKLAQRLDRLQAEHAPGALLPILLECNVSGETAKYGFAAGRWETDGEQRAALLGALDEILALPHIEARGLMTVAPIVAEPEDARPYFARLCRLRDELAATCPRATLPELSMGMTDDFEAAIEEGATIVRIGRAIFAPDLPAWCELPALAHVEDTTP